MDSISVVIPTLQKNKLVLDTLVSLLNDDIKVSEIIIIDNSLKGYKSKFQKVRTIIPKENLFVNPSWNLGVKESKNNYVALFNDDLLVCENFCSKVLEKIINIKDFGVLGNDSSSVINTNNVTKPKCSNFEIVEDLGERCENWGTIIFLKKENYVPIPEKIKIWCGDDFYRYQAEVQNLKIFNLFNANIFHLGSLSSGSGKFEKILKKDCLEFGEIDISYKYTDVYKWALKDTKSKAFSSKIKYIIRKIFSIKNNLIKSHKITTILGIKIKRKYNPIKLGVSYNLFDGEELLESSIIQIRDQVDYINVIYQKRSYYGESASEDLEDRLKDLLERKLIDEIYLYDKNFRNGDKLVYEKEKRDIGLSLAKKAGCTHFLNMDVDEFYDPIQLDNAKEFIRKNKIGISAVNIYEYFKKPEYRFVESFLYDGGFENYNFYCPFIVKIDNKFSYGDSNYFPCLVDPSRRYNNNGKFYLFSKHEIVMHHMNTIRKDLGKKYKNSNFNSGKSREKIFAKNINNFIKNWNFEDNQIGDSEYSLFQNKLIKKVKNKFNINLGE